MAFSDKKGIGIASPFKLHAETMLDIRQQVETIAERDELVTIKAAAAGLRVYVKANKTSYIYNGTGWDEVTKGVAYSHPTGDGNLHVPATGTTHNNQVLIAGTTAGSATWKAITKSIITDFPASLKNPAALTVSLNGTSQGAYDGSVAKSINITPAAIGAATSGHTHSAMTGATASAAGTSGLVPAPAAGKQTAFLRGDGTWVVPTDTDTKTSQTNTATAADYRMLFSNSANDTTETNIARKSSQFLANPATGEFYAKGYRRIDLTGQTIDIDTLNSSSGTPQIMRYIEKTTGGASNITNIPVAGQPFLLDVEVIRWASTSDYITMQTFRSVSALANEYVRYCTNGTWSAWTTRVFTDTKYSLSSFGVNASAAELNYTKGVTSAIQTQLNGKAATSHTHTKSQITDFPTALKNPTALTFTGAVSATYDGSAAKTINIPTTSSVPNSLAIKLNGGTTEGTNLFTFNGSTAKTVNITPALIGAATSGHNHSNMGAATASAAGTAGFVPAPAAGKQTSFLRGDGTWVVPTNTTYSAMKGATASAAGATGLVPAPAAGAQTKFLRGDGTWQEASYTHPNSGVTAGTYKSVTVNAQGHVTGGTNPNTLAGYGITDAAAKSHTHTKSQITDFPTTLPNAAAFTLQLNSGGTEGTNKFTYTGAAAKSVNITPAAIGAAPTSHSHNYLPLSGGTLTGPLYANQGVSSKIISTTSQNLSILKITLLSASDTTRHRIHLRVVSTLDAEKTASYEILFNSTTATMTFDEYSTYKLSLRKISNTEYQVYCENGIGSLNVIMEKDPSTAYTTTWMNSTVTTGTVIYSESRPLKVASSVVNPIMVKLNGGAVEGTNKFTFNGSETKILDITPAAIGAATSSHTHNYAGSSSAGGAATSANKVPVPVGTVLMATSSTTTFFSSCFGGTWECMGNIDATVGTTATTFYMFKKTAN